MAVSEEIGGVHVSITGDYTQLQRDLEASAGYARTAARTISDAFNAGGASGAGLARGFDQAKAGAYDFTRSAQVVIDKQKELDRELIQARGALTDVRLAYEQGAASANALSRAEDNLKTASDRANLALRDVNRAAKEAAEASAKAAADIEASWRRTQQGLTTIGVGLTAAITAPMIAGLHTAITESNKFGLAMHEVASIMDNTSAESFKKLSSDVLDLSVRLGVDATKAAKGLYETLSANIPEGNALSFLEVATKASIAGLTSTKVAVDGLTSVLNAFHFQVSDTTKVADAMFVAVKLGKFRFDELSGAMAKAMPLASQLGVSFQEVLGAAAKITSTGVPVSEAFTQIQRAMASIIAPSGEMKNLFEKIFKTYNVDSGKALLQSQGLVGALQAVREAAGEEEGAIFKAMRRMEGFRAVLELTGPNLESTKQFIDQVTHSSGRMDVAFQEIEKSGARGFDHLKASMEALAITAGDALAPSVGKIVKNMEPLITLLIDSVKWFAALDPEIQKVALIMGVMAASAGPLALMASGLIRLREAMLLMGSATTIATASLNLLSKVPYVAIAAGWLILDDAIVKWGDAVKSSKESAAQQKESLHQLEEALIKAGVSISDLSSNYNFGLITELQYIKGLQSLAIEHGKLIPQVAGAKKELTELEKALAKIAALEAELKKANASHAKGIASIGTSAVEAKTSIDDFMTAWDRLHADALPTAEDLDKAMRQVASAAYDMASAIGEVPPTFGSVTLAEIAANAKEAGISLDVMIPPDLKPKIEEVTQSADRMGDSAVQTGTRTKEAMREVRQAINTISEGIANSIIHWKGWGAAAMSTLEAVGKAILKNIIQQLLEATGIVDTLVAGIGKVLAKIGLGAASGAAGSAASSAAGAGTSAAGTASSAAGGLASATSALATGLSIAGLGVSVASGIVQGIQMAHLESDVAKIEISTRQCKEILGHFQPIFETWLPKLGHLVDIWGALVNSGPLQKIVDILSYGKINVNVVRGEAGTGSANDILTGGMEPGGNVPVAAVPGEPQNSNPMGTFVANIAKLSRGLADLNSKLPTGGYQLKPGESFGASFPQRTELTTQQSLIGLATGTGFSPEQIKLMMDQQFKNHPEWYPAGTQPSDIYQRMYSVNPMSTDPLVAEEEKAKRASLELYRAGTIGLAEYNRQIDAATYSYQTLVASTETLVARFGRLTDVSTPEAQALMQTLQGRGVQFSTPGVTAGYQGGGKAVTDLSGFTSAYQAIQGSGFGGTADLGNSSFVNPAMMRTGAIGAQMSDSDKASSIAAYGEWLQKLAAQRAQQTADALAGMQTLALQQFSKAFQAATEGHNIRMDKTGKLMQLDQAGNLIDADTGKVLVNYEKLYNQFANPTGVQTGMQGTQDVKRTNAMGGMTTFAANMKAYSAAPVDYSKLLQNYSSSLNTSWQGPSPEAFASSLLGGPMGGDSRTIIIQAFDPASRAIGRGLVDELQNNGIYR